MNSTTIKTILAALGSTFFGVAYTAPKPWAFVSLTLSSICITALRLIP